MIFNRDVHFQSANKDSDFIFGFNGDDTIFGGSENDELRGGNGADRIYGDSGDDLIYYANDGDVVDGGAGDDTFVYDSLVQGYGSATIRGGNGYDTIDLSALGEIEWKGRSTSTSSMLAEFIQDDEGGAFFFLDSDRDGDYDFGIELVEIAAVNQIKFIGIDTWVL